MKLSIKSLLTASAGVFALLLLLLLLCTLRLRQELDSQAQAEAQRNQSYLLANELRQSSDDLTRLVRTYAETGDPRYERQYWAVLAIRNGQLPRLSTTTASTGTSWPRTSTSRSRMAPPFRCSN